MPKVTIDITAKDDASSILRKVNNEVKNLDASTKKAKTTTKSFSGASVAMVGGLAGAAYGLYNVGASALKAAGEMEQNRVAFTTMLGSAEKANALLQDMTKFAATTPFQLSEVVTAGKQLTAFGFQQNEIINNMRMLGDVAAGLSQPVGDMVYLFGQIKTQGTAYTQDLMQFANRGVPIYEELAKVLNISTSQVKEFASQGKIGFKEIEKAFKNMTAEGSQFGGLMDAQSDTMLGKWSNFADNMDRIYTRMGDAASGDVKDLIDELNRGTQEGGFIDFLMTDIANAGAGFARLGAMGMKVINDAGDRQVQNAKHLEELEQKRLNLLANAENRSKSFLPINADVINRYKEQLSLLDKQIEHWKRIKTETEKAIEASTTEAVLYSSSTIDQMRKRRAQGTDTKQESPQKKTDTAGAARWRSAQEYYKKIVEEAKMSAASEIEQIELVKQKDIESLVERSVYLTNAESLNAYGIITKKAAEDRSRAEIAERAKAFEIMSNMQIEFYTQSASVEANALGQMSNALMSNFRQVSGEVGKVLSDIAASSNKTGLTMGDSFKIGASVATAALQSVMAVMQMQQQMAQAGFQRQQEALQQRYEAERAAMEERYELEQEERERKEEDSEADIEDADAKRLEDLEAYRASLKGKTDSEIEAAMAKKEKEIKEKAEEKKRKADADKAEKEAEKKKKEEQKAMDRQFAIQKWAIDVQAFQSKQEHDKKAIIMSTALGIIQAWAGAMMLMPIVPAVIAAGGAMTALLGGMASKQLGMVSSQTPPPPPAFAGGVTNFEGGMALVGERGRELVTLPRGANVITNENTEKLLGGGGANVIVNNIYVNGVLTQQDIVDMRQASAYGGY
jgi:tape measure domain-containing protein